MMGIVVPETCWAYKKYNKIISSIYLVLIIQDQVMFIQEMLKEKVQVQMKNVPINHWHGCVLFREWLQGE